MTRAKFRLAAVEEWPDREKFSASEKQGESLRFEAVYSDDPAHVNHTWSRWTPSGTLQMQVTNPALWGRFVVGREYYLDIAEAAE